MWIPLDNTTKHKLKSNMKFRYGASNLTGVIKEIEGIRFLIRFNDWPMSAGFEWRLIKEFTSDRLFGNGEPCFWFESKPETYKQAITRAFS